MLGYVIGDSDMITGFKLVGVEGAEVNSVDEARQALNKALVPHRFGNYNHKRRIFHSTTNA